MKTQKFMAGFMLAMMLLTSFSTMVLAEEAETISIGDSEVADATVTSGFGNGWDKVKLAFTFNKEKKAELALGMAEKRLADAEAMAEAGNSEAAEKARLRYEDFLGKAEEAAEKIQTKKESQTENALIKVEDMQKKLQLHKEKSEAIKAKILEKKAAGDMDEEQLAKLEEVFSKIGERTGEAEAKLEQRQESLRARYKVLSEMSDEEIEAKLEQVREETKNQVGKDNDSDDEVETESDDSDDEASSSQAKTGQSA